MTHAIVQSTPRRPLLRRLLDSYRRCSITTKIVAVFAVVTGGAIAAALCSTWIIVDVSSRGGAMYERNLLSVSRISALRSAFETGQTLVRDLVIERAPYVQDEILAKLAAEDKQVITALITPRPLRHHHRATTRPLSPSRRPAARRPRLRPGTASPSR